MGRKRKAQTKKRITISLDEELLEKMKEWEINRSLFFTECAKRHIQELEEEKGKRT